MAAAVAVEDSAAEAMPRPQPRVVLAFPSNADDMLLSGVLVGGQSLANRAQVVDAPLGQGHVVMFAIRPFWRWQTQGTFFLGFNAILNWNDLSAGRPAPRRRSTRQPRSSDEPSPVPVYDRRWAGTSSWWAAGSSAAPSRRNWRGAAPASD